MDSLPIPPVVSKYYNISSRLKIQFQENLFQVYQVSSSDNFLTISVRKRKRFYAPACSTTFWKKQDKNISNCDAQADTARQFEDSFSIV